MSSLERRQPPREGLDDDNSKLYASPDASVQPAVVGKVVEEHEFIPFSSQKDNVLAAEVLRRKQAFLLASMSKTTVADKPPRPTASHIAADTGMQSIKDPKLSITVPMTADNDAIMFDEEDGEVRVDTSVIMS